MQAMLADSVQWYTASKVSPQEPVCPTRDIFQARLDSLYRSLLAAGQAEHATALLIAVVGEIGNNCFDHNLGTWNDVPGCRFTSCLEQDTHWIIIADRGQGILASLRRVAPQLASHQEALETAFQKQLSGRAPEQRGNGLKFVRQVINGHAGCGVCCVSGDGIFSFGELADQLTADVADHHRNAPAPGTLTLIGWRMA